MRLIIVSADLPRISGVCVGTPNRPRREELVGEVTRLIESPGSAGHPSFGHSVGRAVALAVAGPYLGLLGALAAGSNAVVSGAAERSAAELEAARLKSALPQLIRSAYDEGFLEGEMRAATGNASKEVLGAIVATQSEAFPKHRLPFEDHCVTVAAPVVLGERAPILVGQFDKQGQLAGVLGADGGTSRVHLFNREAAREVFQRHGGGVLEDGRYVLHPKRENVLVPLASFHLDMLQEMVREVRVVMGRIGAKRLVVETIEGVTMGGRVVSRVPLKSASAAVEHESRESRSVSYEWDPPTFDFDHALEGCVWIHDNAGAMTIVDQRRTSSLIRYEEYNRQDTSFKVGIDVMKLFNASFNWASESTYRYAVDFFPKPSRA